MAGRKRKSVEDHIRDGTWRGDRHESPEVKIVRPRLPKPIKTYYRPHIPIDFDEMIMRHYGDTRAALKTVPRSLSQATARKWIWDESDEIAVANGCRFDLVRAMHYAYVCRDNLVLWESSMGTNAGDPFVLRTWQIECQLRIFGWVRKLPTGLWVRRFNKAAVWVPKKSGKSPVGASVGVYMWKFDGKWTGKRLEPIKENGQHVYSIARNGKQAKIVHNHARVMSQQSPTLGPMFERTASPKGQLLKYHSQTKTLTDISTESTYEILAGDNASRTQAAEGLNAGCIVCDEAHVVDQAMVNVTTDAGASKDQFLWYQISTCGEGDSYGKRDRDYGREVALGKHPEDDATFFKEYGAPDDATDEDCKREETWIAANPNWGFTVNPVSFRQAFLRAQKTPSDFANWKQRRLNIWQTTANAMLSIEQWNRCATQLVTLEHMAQLEGLAAGLDLAVYRDFAAFAVVHKTEGDEFTAWVKLWMPDTFEQKYADKTPVLEWEPDDIDVHAGEINLPTVEQEILELIVELDIEVLGFDQMHAAQMAQSLADQTGCKIVKYPQTMRAYAHPTSTFINAINAGRFRHPANPVLDWMAEHVQSLRQGNLQRPIRDPDKPWLKIDGIQAVIMGVDCAHYVEGVGRQYDEPGSFLL